MKLTSPFFKRLLNCRNLIQLLFLIPTFTNASADRLVYSYDASGNRQEVERTIYYSRGSNKSRTSRSKLYLDSLSSARITIYPNPTEGDIRIDIAGITDFKSSSLTVCDLKGRILYQMDELTESNELDITDYASGTYLFIIRIKEETTTWKIIKK